MCRLFYFFTHARLTLERVSCDIFRYWARYFSGIPLSTSCGRPFSKASYLDRASPVPIITYLCSSTYSCSMRTFTSQSCNSRKLAISRFISTYGISNALTSVTASIENSAALPVCHAVIEVRTSPSVANHRVSSVPSLSCIPRHRPEAMKYTWLHFKSCVTSLSRFVKFLVTAYFSISRTTFSGILCTCLNMS